MADDLDQGYMQTRQTMRDWQNRMLFMETTQEGNQVHMGVQVGGKETDGGKAGTPGQAPTEQDVRNSFLEPRIGQAIVDKGAQPADPKSIISGLGQGNEFDQSASTRASINYNEAGSPSSGISAQPSGVPRNTITVDTPEVAALKQQFSAHMQEVASGEAGMKALGKGGKALAEAARPGFEVAARAIGMDEQAAATVGDAFVEFMGGLPGQEQSDYAAGLETALAALPVLSGMYKAGKFVAKSPILKSQRGSVPVPFGGKDHAKKHIWEMSAEELDHGADLKAKTDAGINKEVLGDRAEEFAALEKRLERTQNFSDTPGYKEAERRYNEILDSIPKEQQDRMYGVGEKDHQVTDYRAFRRAIEDVQGDTPQELGQSISRAITEVGKGNDPSTMTQSQQIAYAQIRHAFQEAKRMGWDTKEVSQAAIAYSARRFSDPEDAAFMLERFMKPAGSGIEDAASQMKAAIIQEFRKAGDILKSERGSVPLGGGGTGKPPRITAPGAAAPGEEPISPKALATISRREQAKSDFTIKVEGFKDELTKQRRGPVLSDEAVRKLAGESGFTLQDLLDLKPGSILAPEIQVAARDVFKASADKMKASAKAYLERADPQAFDEFAQAFAEAGIATTRIIGTFAEGGRTFRLFNQKYPTLKTGVKPDGKDPEFSIQDQYIQAMYKFFRGVEEKSKIGGFDQARTGQGMGAGGMVSPGHLAQMVMDLPNEEAMMAFAKAALKPTWGDMMMEVWINGLLSGPITHSTNIISNAATVAWNIPERAVASMLNPKAVRPGEAAAMLGGVVESMGDAWRLAWKAFKEEQPQFGQSKLEMPRRAITADALEVTGMTGRAVDFLGAAVRLPGRFLMAGDDFFKAIAFRAELRALAKRQAFREINEMSLTGKAAAQKAREIEKNILDNPPESIKDAAQEFAAYTTFTRDLGETGQKVQALASTPIGRIVLPFVRTPTNIFKFAGERTPLALASRAVREEIAAGGERRALALAKIGLGSMTMAYMSTLAANGLITGGGPKDKTLRQIKMQTGWKPYSFKIGNEYISYARIEPLGSLFGLAADAADIMGQLSEADAAKLASALTVAISRNVAQKTFVKGLAGTLNAVTSQEVKLVNSFLEKELPTILPYSSALGQTAKNVDPVMREVNSIMDAFKAKIPGYSSDLPPHRNLWGEPVLLEGGLGPDLLSPFYSSTVKDDKVAAELSRLEAPITLPSKQIDRVPLTPKQYDRYQILAAHPQGMPGLREKLEEVIASDLYRHGTDDPADGGKITLLKMWVNNYRDLAKFQLRQEDADLDAKLRERETKKAGAFAGTAPGGLSR